MNLHKHFVITTVDKANDNQSFICKKFYIAFKKEPGISGNLLHKNVRGNTVYEIQNNQLLNDHSIKNSNLDVTLSERNKCVPNLKVMRKQITNNLILSILYSLTSASYYLERIWTLLIE